MVIEIKMARYSTAYSDFIKRLTEVEILLSRASQLEESDFFSDHEEARVLVRSAILLFCSHIEGYVKNLGRLALDTIVTKNICKCSLPAEIGYFLTRPYWESVRDTSEPIDIAVKLSKYTKEHAHFWYECGPITCDYSVENFNQKLQSAKYNRIKQYMAQFGYSDFDHHLKCKAKAEHSDFTRSLELMVTLRNKVAHGDESTSAKTLKIREELKTLRRFCCLMDEVFGDWFRDNICAIR